MPEPVNLEIDLAALPVVHNAAASRFEVILPEETALLTYRTAPGEIAFLHTDVPPGFRGRGLAAKIVRAALDFARAEHLKVLPYCPYVAAFMRRYPQYQDVLAPGFKG